MGHVLLENTTESLTASKELTDEDIDRMKQEMSTKLTPVQMDKFAEILSKFKAGTTAMEKLGGMV